MRFKINRDHFTSGLSKVLNVVSSRNTMPILNNVLLIAEKDQLTLTTTNLDLGISCSIKAEVKEPGAITLPVRKLATIIKSLPNIEVDVDASSSNQAKITSGGSLFRIMGIGQEEFPPLPTIPSDQAFSITQSKLLHMLKSVSYAQSTDENRFILNGIYFNLQEEALTLVATDGRRLGLITEPIDNPQNTTSTFILPAKTANEVERLLGQGENLKIAFTDRQVSFSIDISEESQESGLTSSLFLTSKVVEGNYPNYQQVIPKETTHRIKIDREQLLESLSRAALVTSDKANSIKIRLSNNLLEINGSSPELGESHESIAVDFNEPNVELSFNPQFLIDPLKAIPKDEVFFEFKDELSPGLFKTMESFLCVVMPLRLN